MDESTKPIATDPAAALRTAVERYTSEGGHVAPPGAERAADEVSFDGRQYRYETYRYDRREDAIAYAELVRERRDASAARSGVQSSQSSAR